MTLLDNTYIQYGVPSDWAARYKSIGLSVSSFRTTTRKNLISKYNVSEEEIDFVKDCLIRKPIDEATGSRLLENSNYLCCLCKGEKGKAYILHHIVEYSQSKDNSYKNLAVLCPNDHDLAHREGIALTSKISAQQIRMAKKNWEKLVKDGNAKKAVSSKWRNIASRKLVNPFKELQSYKESDEAIFFGRSLEIKELVARILKDHIVGLFGESGTGKTSLINAGIIPRLREFGLTTVVVRCLDEPIKRIKEGLIAELKANNIAREQIEDLVLCDTFPRMILKLKELSFSEKIKVLIVVDQFEELFTRAQEKQRELLAKGIIEALIGLNENIYFLFSLREDYIGDLWDWSHSYNFEDAWIRQYRINRLTKEKAFEVVAKPLNNIGVDVEVGFIEKVLSELVNITNSVYPPYLQIVCSKLFQEWEHQKESAETTTVFGSNLYIGNDSVESIVADYLSESMLSGLTDSEKQYAQSILDTLTGPEGLRAFLNTDDICRMIGAQADDIQHVLEHLIRKKIVHPVVEADKLLGYELVHDFLSKKFFEKLGPEEQKAKTIVDLFGRAFKEWQEHGILASRERLEKLAPFISQLQLGDEEWHFLVKSSFSVYWLLENDWRKVVNTDILVKISSDLVNDSDDRISRAAIHCIGELKTRECSHVLLTIIESPDFSDARKEQAISQFAYYIMEPRVINILPDIIRTATDSKMRKTSVYAFGKNLRDAAQSDTTIVDRNIAVLFDALDDPMTSVRREAASILGNTIIHRDSEQRLLSRLRVEKSIQTRKAIVSALGSLIVKGLASESSINALQEIAINIEEDFRVQREAKLELERKRQIDMQ